MTHQETGRSRGAPPFGTLTLRPRTSGGGRGRVDLLRWMAAHVPMSAAAIGGTLNRPCIDEIRDLKARGLVERVPVVGSRHALWRVTVRGRAEVAARTGVR